MNFSGTRPGGAEGATVVGTGDFSELLRMSGNAPATVEVFRSGSVHAVANAPANIEATTVLSFHYKDGVLIAGDRRATAGNISCMTAPTR